MSYEQTLKTEINATLDTLHDAGELWEPKWIAHQIVANHQVGLKKSTHRDFWEHCAYSKVREMVTRCINRRAGDKAGAAGEQYILPGYAHVQTHYVVSRGGEDVGVPIDLLTDAELCAKAVIYKKMGEACFAHADELDRYRTNRMAAA